MKLKLKTLAGLGAIFAASVLISGCDKNQNSAGASSDASGPSAGQGQGMQEVAVITTRHGEIVIKFNSDVAPKHVESFKKLAGQGFYDGTIFHRVIPGFMIQGGDPNTKDLNKVSSYGTGGPGYTVPAEFSSVKHLRGIVSAARSQDPNSAGSQFFIVVKDSPWLDGQYSVFGEVISGMEVADKIVNEQRDPRDMPLARVEMTIRLEQRQL